MSDLHQDTPRPSEPADRGLPLRRRLEGVVLGAASGGAAGWLGVVLGGVSGVLHWWVVAGLAALAAAMGYRYGRRVVLATLEAFAVANPDG